MFTCRLVVRQAGKACVAVGLVNICWRRLAEAVSSKRPESRKRRFGVSEGDQKACSNANCGCGLWVMTGSGGNPVSGLAEQIASPADLTIWLSPVRFQADPVFGADAVSARIAF